MMQKLIKEKTDLNLGKVNKKENKKKNKKKMFLMNRRKKWTNYRYDPTY